MIEPTAGSDSYESPSRPNLEMLTDFIFFLQNEKSAQSPPRTPMSNSVPKSNQLSGPSTPTPRIKLNLSPIVTRNPKGSISHNLPTHGGTVTTADSGNVTSGVCLHKVAPYFVLRDGTIF